MKLSTTARIVRTNAPLVVAALAAVLLWSTAPSAHAMGKFGSAGERETPIFCDMPAIKGAFSSTVSRYEASGVCVQVQAYSFSDKDSGRSEFADVNHSKELFRAAWTAQGSYDPVTKETWEKVTMPAPAVDQQTPPGRPYGTYETRMICATDPWLTGLGVKCTGKTAQAKGNVGDMAAMMGALNQPLTTPNKQPLLQALNASHDRYERMHSVASAATSKRSAVAALFAPTIVEPKPGSTHRPQTAMSIRVASAQNARDTNYMLEIQQTSTPQLVGQANAQWHDLTNIPVTAAEAQSSLGYRGWGAHVDGTGPQMTASLGTYRVRARATAPKRSEPGEWVEFTIAGTAGSTKDDLARTRLDGITGARSALGLGTQAATSEVPMAAATSRAGAASLITQRPPQNAAVTQSPLIKATRKADAAALNPQPLPPVNPPTVLPTQAPSALR